MEKPESDEIHVTFRKRAVYRPNKNWAQEMGFKRPPDTAKDYSRLSDAELEEKIQMGGIVAFGAEMEKESRTWRGKLQRALYIALMAAIGILCLGAIVWGAIHYGSEEKVSAQDDSTACLHDADCRARLEAAVNDIYSEIGYETEYSAR